MQRILVWDGPTRIGHWLLALAFALAYATGDSEEWRLVHVAAGGTLAGVVLFRLLWGILGTRHALFWNFLDTPAAAWRYLRALPGGQPPHSTGHNPAGGYAVLALLTLGLLAAASGWAVYQELGGEALEELHEGVVNLMLLVVGIHLAGVAVGSLVHRENLPRAMLTGYKQGEPEEAIRSSRWWAVPLLLTWVAAAAWLFSR